MNYKHDKSDFYHRVHNFAGDADLDNKEDVAHPCFTPLSFALKHDQLQKQLFLLLR